MSLRCPLPSHGGEDKSPSFRVCIQENGPHEKGFWKCHKEGLSGSIIDLVIALGHAADFKAACSYLRIGLGNTCSTPEKQRQRRDAGKSLSVVSPEVLETQANALQANGDAMDYLLNVRGLTPDVIRAAGLGFGERPFPALTIPYRAEDQVIRNCKNIAWPKPRKSSKRPRALFSEKGGWQGLYAPFQVTSDPVFVVESELDCLLLWSIGCQAIATGGTSRMTIGALTDLIDTGCKAIVYADTDGAGSKVVDSMRIDLFKIRDSRGIDVDVDILVPEHSGKAKDIGDQFVYFFTGDAKRDPQAAREMLQGWLKGRLEDSVSNGGEMLLEDVLDKTEEGKNKKTQRNLRLVLTHGNRLAGRLWVSAMGERMMWGDRSFRDSDITKAQEWIESGFGASFGVDAVHKKMVEVAESRRRHLVQEYLKNLKWDGTPRVHRMIGGAIQLVGSESDLELKRSYLRRWLISAVARAMKPGCKADAMLVLVGEQGLGKSTFGATLAGFNWFCDQDAQIESKDYLAEIHRHWIVEMSELDATTRRKDISQLRAFVSRQVDTFRPAYGRVAVELERSFVFLGTTNQQSIVREDNGRRYWPIHVASIDFDWVFAHRDQIWAEVRVLFDEGEQWWLDDAENALRVRDTEDSFSEVDPALEVLMDWLENPESPTEFTIRNVVTELNQHGLSRAHYQIGSLLRDSGCESYRVKSRGNGRDRRFWSRSGARHRGHS